jgi:GMP synthase (glutamine-hydrolysing)
MIAIIDFGSQYTQLIARRIREAHVYCEVFPYWVKSEELEYTDGIILSGSPTSISKGKPNLPMINKDIFNLGKPVLGLCYGMQQIAHLMGGGIHRGGSAEYGKTECQLDTDSPIFNDISKNLTVWMSHGDSVEKIPPGFEVIAQSKNCPVAAFQNAQKKIYGLQFHPEVSHTDMGSNIISNFLFSICRVEPSWRMSAFLDSQTAKIKEQVGDDHVIVGVSGGVDSVVTAVLLHKAIGSQLHSIFIDHGLLRQNEREEVANTLTNLGLKPVVVDAGDRFLSALDGITDPEDKRINIGRLFIEEFDSAVNDFPDSKWLAQGTLYPDVIESSGGVSGLADKIKSHHNVGGLPKKMNLKLIEPLKTLFKDEVRHLGRELGIPKNICDRQPFPGPGLAIRIIGEITIERLDILRRVDWIVRDEIKPGQSDQYFAVLLPIASVGVKGDERAYHSVVAIRAATTTDFMTAEWTKFPHTLLDRIASRITGEVPEVGRVVYDITNKPPATIEWE